MLRAFANIYGAEMLDIAKKLNEEVHAKHEARKATDIEAQCIQSECRAVEKTLQNEKMQQAQQLKKAKESSVIPGTDWYV